MFCALHKTAVNRFFVLLGGVLGMDISSFFYCEIFFDYGKGGQGSSCEIIIAFVNMLCVRFL